MEQMKHEQETGRRGAYHARRRDPASRRDRKGKGPVWDGPGYIRKSKETGMVGAGDRESAL